MVILVVNKFLFRNGGSEACMFDTVRLLEDRGHRVVFMSMEHPENLQVSQSSHLISNVDFRSTGLVGRTKAAARMLYSREARAVIDRVVREERPDVALLHNIYHHLSPSILGPLAEHRVPAFLTLHDYKLVCPVYTLYSGGEPCERCRGGAFHHCVTRRCSRGSITASALVAAETLLHRRLLHSYDSIAGFLSPSRFLMEKLLEMGFAGPLHHIPNFLDVSEVEPCPAPAHDNRTFVYFGRLTREKGLFTLIDAMQGLPATCHIVGRGPVQDELRTRVAGRGLGNVRFSPHLPFSELTGLICDARAVVLPSEWYENSPRSVLEAFALGRAVIAARIGGIPELVQDRVTGLTFEPGNATDLRRALETFLHSEGLATSMGRAARELVERGHTPAAHYQQLMTLIREALEVRAKSA